MHTKAYKQLPQEAKQIRTEVFMNEQGFQNEFDSIDKTACHIVAFHDQKPIGTCRFFQEENHYTIGRVAVLKEYRKLHVGKLLLDAAEKEIRKQNGKEIVLHSQFRVYPFYEKQGYVQFGNVDEDEGVPHVWMKKKIQ